MFAFIAVGLGIAYFLHKFLTHPRAREVSAGLQQDITLPHTDELELYHTYESAMCKKVRACLAEAGLRFKSHHVDLPSGGSFDTKTAAFLRINPAGTVPVLVHNGHPVYESHEQIKYIEKFLLPEGRESLSFPDAESREDVNRWVEYTAMFIIPEMFENPEVVLSETAGNILPAISLPLFGAMAVTSITWRQVLEGILMSPFLADRMFVITNLGFKVFGIRFLKMLPPLRQTASFAREALLTHLDYLESELEKHGGPYIFGDKFTLADIGWVPILDRMELARWWEHVDNNRFKRVWAYWEAIQARPSFELCQSQGHNNELEVKARKQLEAWKREFKWVNELYEL